MRYEEAERRTQEAAVRTGRTHYVIRGTAVDDRYDYSFSSWPTNPTNASKTVTTITPEQAREALAQVQAETVRAERFKGTLL